VARLITAWVLALAYSVGAGAQSMQIQFAEPVEIDAGAANTQFDAYGRRFALELAGNDRLVNALSAQSKLATRGTRILRGRLPGQPGSWVRLTARGNDVAGAIWDGNDLYFVSSYARVAPLLTQALSLPPDQPVIYRLSDTVNVLPSGFCALQSTASPSSPANGLTQFKGLVSELKLQFTAVPTDQLDISLIADSALQATYSGPNDDLTRAMLNTLNIVDGIYDAQLGLAITASDLRMIPASADPFTETDSSALLAQLQTYRTNTPAVSSRALAHLFTRRTLDDGSTLGIARLGGACAANGVSLTSVSPSGLGEQSALVMAHEIGHNLNAEHDTTSCGETWLMWPEYSYLTRPQFSQCSLDAMRPFITQHRGACITPPLYGDVAVQVEDIPAPVRTEPFTWPVHIRSVGTAPLTDAVVYIDMQGASLTGVATTHGACAPYNGVQRCDLGGLAPGAAARVDLSITATFPGDVRVRATVDAANDRYETNNISTITVSAQHQAIVGLAISPAQTTALVGDPVTYTYSVASRGLRTARDVQVSLGGGSYFHIDSVTSTQGTCNGVSCNLGDIPTGNTPRISVTGRAVQGGNTTVSGQLSSSNAYLDPQFANAQLTASANYDLELVAPPPYHLVAVGVPYELVIPIRANGTRDAVGGLFRMNPGNARVLSVNIDGTACAPTTAVAAEGGGCPLGTVVAGQQKVVRVRIQFDTPSTTGMYLAADNGGDEVGSNNSANLNLTARFANDVGLSLSSSSTGNTEGELFLAQVTLSSQGAEDAHNVVATLDVPAGVRIVSALMPQGTCTATGDRRIVCSRAVIAVNQETHMTVTMVGDEPASYRGTFSVAADNDGVPSNNTLAFDILVGALADVGLNTIPALPGFIVNQPREFTVEVVTGTRRPVPDVRVTFPSSDSLVLEAIATPVGNCVINVTTPYCDLGMLPANSLIRLTPRYRATRSGTSMSAWVSVTATRDVDFSNNSRSVTMNTYDPGDVGVSAATATATGTSGSTLTLPRITLSTVTRSLDTLIEITLPSFVTVTQVSFGAGVCTGTTTLQCYMADRASGSSDTLDITVRLDGTGTFTSNIRVSGRNDTNPANDTASFQLTSNAVTNNPPAGSSSSGGSSGGGGGGSLEWLSLGVLALLARRRQAEFFGMVASASSPK
jgi:Reprolysin (M12B) family zinc metalloprotease/Domain of unknown function DUF11